MDHNKESPLPKLTFKLAAPKNASSSGGSGGAPAEGAGTPNAGATIIKHRPAAPVPYTTSGAAVWGSSLKPPSPSQRESSTSNGVPKQGSSKFQPPLPTVSKVPSSTGGGSGLKVKLVLHRHSSSPTQPSVTYNHNISSSVGDNSSMSSSMKRKLDNPSQSPHPMRRADDSSHGSGISTSGMNARRAESFNSSNVTRGPPFKKIKSDDKSSASHNGVVDGSPSTDSYMMIDVQTPDTDNATMQLAMSNDSNDPATTTTTQGGKKSKYKRKGPPRPKPGEPGYKPPKKKPLFQILKKFITNLKQKDIYGFFLTPVDTDAVTGYLDMIKEPMDFGTMDKKIAKREYRDIEDFKRDLLLVTNNCKTFNQKDTIYYSEADRLEQMALGWISREAPNIAPLTELDLIPEEEEEEVGSGRGGGDFDTETSQTNLKDRNIFDDFNDKLRPRGAEIRDRNPAGRKPPVDWMPHGGRREKLVKRTMPDEAGFLPASQRKLRKFNQWDALEHKLATQVQTDGSAIISLNKQNDGVADLYESIIHDYFPRCSPFQVFLHKYSTRHYFTGEEVDVDSIPHSWHDYGSAGRIGDGSAPEVLNGQLQKLVYKNAVGEAYVASMERFGGRMVNGTSEKVDSAGERCIREYIESRIDDVLAGADKMAHEAYNLSIQSKQAKQPPKPLILDTKGYGRVDISSALTDRLKYGDLAKRSKNATALIDVNISKEVVPLLSLNEGIPNQGMYHVSRSQLLSDSVKELIEGGELISKDESNSGDLEVDRRQKLEMVKTSVQLRLRYLMKQLLNCGNNPAAGGAGGNAQSSQVVGSISSVAVAGGKSSDAKLHQFVRQRQQQQQQFPHMSNILPFSRNGVQLASPQPASSSPTTGMVYTSQPPPHMMMHQQTQQPQFQQQQPQPQPQLQHLQQNLSYQMHSDFINVKVGGRPDDSNKKCP
ncbi:hypothetical protein SeMB42_g01467 [Synchytrium endobioticum]|uniref:Bromo domain-containing protein n=1 Tax=Synchytrium endobioticum TaxID=286115 RepID=A0A507DM84_9FUNG|nr:hypothetical protein SeLEV6574_g01206 [Synchytrium endobioticum]TPX52345.1 hypothetical protein SeMB42_g01467 [Synchytrium endobioticum]